MSLSGFFISFEGIDGCGKSLQARNLQRNLEKMGASVLSIRDPGGPPLSEAIRRLLLDNGQDRMHPMTELLLYEAARSQLVTEKVLPALESGCIVITDRFMDSTTAYQGWGRGLDRTVIGELNRLGCHGRYPDRTYILEIPWEESLRRRQAMRPDRMESEAEDFFNRIREAYRSIARESGDRVLLLDGTKSVKTLEQVILNDVLILLRRHGYSF